jgi:hypothetical protein
LETEENLNSEEIKKKLNISSEPSGEDGTNN